MPIVLVFLAGAMLGFRYKVIVLVPSIAAILICGAGVSLTTAMVVTLQVGYLAGSTLKGWPRRSLRTQEQS